MWFPFTTKICVVISNPIQEVSNPVQESMIQINNDQLRIESNNFEEMMATYIQDQSEWLNKNITLPFVDFILKEFGLIGNEIILKKQLSCLSPFHLLLFYSKLKNWRRLKYHHHYYQIKRGSSKRKQEDAMMKEISNEIFQKKVQSSSKLNQPSNQELYDQFCELFSSVSQSSFSQIRDELIEFDPLILISNDKRVRIEDVNWKWVSIINLMESFYWMKSSKEEENTISLNIFDHGGSGKRVDSSLNILGFDCGGQQLVFEVCIPIKEVETRSEFEFLEEKQEATNKEVVRNLIDHKSIFQFVDQLKRNPKIEDDPFTHFQSKQSYSIPTTTDLMFAREILKKISDKKLISASPIEQR